MPRMMRLAKIVLASLSGLLALALIALAVATLVVDPDVYRPTIQRQLSEALGRDVSIDRLSIGKSLRPTITVTGLRIANAPWASQPNFVSVNSASVRLDLVPLVRGEIEIGSVDVTGVALSLERDGNGVGNWELPTKAPQDRSDEPVTLPDFDRISLQDVKVAWRNIDGSSIGVQVQNAEAVLRAERPLELDATVVYRDVPIRAQLKAERSLQSALGGEPVSASLVLDAVQTRLDLGIAMPTLFDIKHFDATVAARGKRANSLTPLLDQALPAWGPYAFSAKVSVRSPNVEISELRLAIHSLPDTVPFAVSKVTVNSGLVSLGSAIPTTLTLAGSLDEMDFVLDATSADIVSLKNSFERVPLSARMRISGFALAADGELHFGEDAFSFDFAAAVKGDTGVPARIIGNLDMTQPLDVDLASRVAGNGQQVTLSALAGIVANCSVAGDVAVQYSPRVRVDGGLDLGRFDIAAFDVFAKPSRARSKEKTEDGSSAWLSALDGDLRLRVREIVGLPVAASNLSGRAVLSGGRLAVQAFRGSVNDTQIRATAGLQYRKNRPYIDADISLPVLDLEHLHSAARQNNGAAKKNKGAASDGKGRGGEEGGLDSPLPLAALRNLDADVKVAIAQVKASPVSVQHLRASAQLQRGHLRVSAFDATTAGVTSRSTLTLDATGDDARLRVTSQSRQIDLAALFRELGVTSDVLGRLADASITIDTHGQTLRNWLRNAKANASVGASRLKLRDRDQELEIEQASITAGPDVPVKAELRGKVEEVPLQLSATGGLLADLLLSDSAWPDINAELRTTVKGQPVRLYVASALNSLRAGHDVPVRVELHSPNGLTTVVGTIADLQKPASSPFVVKTDVKSLATLPLLLEKSPLPDIPLKANGTLVVSQEFIALEGLRLQAGQTDLAGKVQLHRKDRQSLIVDLSGNLLDLRPWYRKPEFKTDKPTEGDSKLDQRFDLSAMRKLDTDLMLRVKRVVSHRMDLDDFAVKATLDQGMLNYAVSIKEGGTNVSGRLDGRTDVLAVAIRVHVKDLDVEELKPADMAVANSQLPKFTANVQFAGSGATPRAIYSSAKGLAVLSTGPGQVTNARTPFLLQTVSADLLQVLVSGKKPDDFNQLECAAARFEVKDGIANSPSGIAFRFKRMDILGSGAINLESGKILFGFKAVRRHWLDFNILSVTSDFASITGTVDKPQVGLDTQGVLITGGAAWATAGLSLLATNFLRTMSSSEDPCADIIEKGQTVSDPIDALMKSLQAPAKP